ncbi:MAG: hypothetical protein ABII71_02495 [Candidatus Micrarchaeota archaeon]
MIGKPEWFTTRKFGWGLGIRSKEGIIYIAAALAIVFALAVLPLDGTVRLAVMALVIGALLVDTLHIMVQIYSKLDEREQRHQMLAETNAAYVGVIGIALYIVYLIVDAGLKDGPPDPSVIMPLAAILILMSVAKGGTFLYLWRGGH